MAFDGYHRWLGIAPQDQPPNHYRLLGVDPFERDPAVIEAAADRQMGHLRTYQSGERSALSQKLLNEVAAAKVCLLNPKKKAEYDRRLRGQFKAKQKPIPKAKPLEPDELERPGDPDLNQLFEKTGGGADLAAAQAARGHRQAQMAAGAAIVVAGLIAVAGLVIWATASTNPTLVALDWPESQRSAGRLEIDGNPVDLRLSGKLEYPLAPGEHRVTAKRPGYEPFDERFTLTEGKTLVLAPGWRKLPPKPPVPKPKPTATPTSPTTKPPAQKPPEVAPSKVEPPNVANDTPKPADPQPKDEPVQKPGKRPAPPVADRAKVVAELNELFELSKPRKATEAMSLAQQMFDLAGNSAKPAEQYVLLQTAANLFCEAGDGAEMLRAIDRLAAVFEVDALAEKRAMVVKLAGRADDSESIAILLAANDQVIDEALANRRYDIALELAEAAYKLCTQSAGRKYRKRAFDRRKEVQALTASWKELQAVFDKLDSSPDDPEANLIAGRHYCFEHGDWDKGLPHLAKSSDAELKRLAQQELQSPPSELEGMLKLADAWWSLSEGRQGKEKRALMLRASIWYRQAQPAVTSTLRKAKIGKRLEQADKIK